MPRITALPSPSLELPLMRPSCPLPRRHVDNSTWPCAVGVVLREKRGNYERLSLIYSSQASLIRRIQ